MNTRKVNIPWEQIDFVLLDMDGTILDRHFDEYFWEEYLPARYAKDNRIPLSRAKKKLSAVFKEQEKTLNWTDLYYWSGRLEMDVVSLKEELQDQVRIHSGVETFLQFLLDEKKDVSLVTNAHPKTVQIKLEQTLLLPYFRTILCSSDIGMPKEEFSFWRDAAEVLGFDKKRTLFIDDTEDVLHAAHAFGVKHILQKSHASSQRYAKPSGIFKQVQSFTDLLP
ncbi:MAG: HAD-IA family hydrolase [Nitrospiria bacterium]